MAIKTWLMASLAPDGNSLSSFRVVAKTQPTTLYLISTLLLFEALPINVSNLSSGILKIFSTLSDHVPNFLFLEAKWI